MSYPENIVEEYGSFLTCRGYDEASLNSPDRSGELISNLRRILKRSTVLMLVDPFPAVGFVLGIHGFPGKGGQMVRFDLHMRFDPKSGQLNIWQLGVYHNGHSVKIQLKRNDELPRPNDAFDYLIRNINVVIEGRQAKKIIPFQQLTAIILSKQAD